LGNSQPIIPFDGEIVHTEVMKNDSHFVRLRLYIPHVGNVKSYPVLLWFYGGGFVIGSLNETRNKCVKLSEKSGFLIVSSEYSQAPEDPFPAAVEDVAYALKWTYSNIKNYGGDPNRIVIGGESAGGNLAAVLASNYISF
jgi:acetyl esterase